MHSRIQFQGLLEVLSALLVKQVIGRKVDYGVSMDVFILIVYRGAPKLPFQNHAANLQQWAHKSGQNGQPPCGH